MFALGAAPHFLASSLVGVIAQRLVPQLCAHCRVAYELPGVPAAFDGTNGQPVGERKNVIYGSRGCQQCGESGYQGRCGVFEILTADKKVRHLIAENRPRDEFHEAALEEGMNSFRLASLAALSEGRTSIEEVTRVIPSQVLGLEN